jgi:hypothetical protein
MATKHAALAWLCFQCWQVRDTFDPSRLMNKFEHGAEFDWDDLRDLVTRCEH